MSTSSYDHYNALLAQQRLEERESELFAKKESIADLEGQIAALQARLQVEQHERDDIEMNVSEAREELAEANAIVANNVPIEEGQKVIDPVTGQVQGEKIELSEDGHFEFLENLERARAAMERGDLEEARRLDHKGEELRKSFDFNVNKYAIGFPSAIQVTSATFVQAKSVATEEQVAASVAYAKTKLSGTVESGTDEAFQAMRWMAMAAGQWLGDKEEMSEEVNPVVLCEIVRQRRELFQRTKENQSDDGDEDMEGENEGQDDEYKFEMSEAAWEAIEKAILNGMGPKKSLTTRELQLPRPNSAPIARYNPNGHFAFESEQASASVDGMLDAMCCLTLPNRPEGYMTSDNNVRRPFEILCGGVESMDIEGDMIAMCGDLYPEDFMDSHGYVGYRMVPRLPVNLASAKSISDLKDANGHYWMKDTNYVYEEGLHRPKLWLSCVAADPENRRIWASSVKGKVRAFSTADNASIHSRTTAMLSFDQKEINALKKYSNVHYDIVKCGDYIVGSGNTGRLSVWNMQAAADDYASSPTCKAAQAKAEASNGEESDSSTERMDVDREQRKKEEEWGTAPQIITVEPTGFACGDIQYLGARSNQLLLAPTRILGGPDGRSTALRLFDLASESVVGLFMGGQGDASIEKQHCVDSHNLVFSMDGCTGFGWDVRTFKPAYAIHGSGGRQILGIPTSSPVAFIFDRSEEYVSCYDLRMPASHCYKMATGNLQVTSMHWHEGTSSIIASTQSKHAVSYGRYGGAYRYGQPIEESSIEDGAWPSQASHEPTYFGDTPWHIDAESRCLLQYFFETK